MLRLFIAFDIPSTIKEQVQNICYGVQHARWVTSNQIHCTLRFIGECSTEEFYAIEHSLSMIALPAFSLSLKSVGYFPPKGAPRILWVGITPSDDVQVLRTTIDKQLQNIGIPDERKNFHPHITVARLRDACTPPMIIPFLTQNSLFQSEPFDVTDFHLYSSILRNEGATHQKEQTFSLYN